MAFRSTTIRRARAGAFVACCHSGVTLASNHAFEIARMVAAGALEPDLVGGLHARRFGVAGNGQHSH